MQVTREAALTLLVLSCIAAGVAATLEDGIPRPNHFADAPTTSYGPYPELVNDDGSNADCDWYGFANLLYPGTAGLSCLDEMRAALTNATENPPSTLKPFLYYTLRRMIDPANNESYCYQGCFNLGFFGAPASSPSYAPGPYVSEPISAPIYSPIPSPYSYEGPAMAPVVVDSPYSSPQGSPALAPAPQSGL
ncbi:hypothetical protein KC19_4G256600 [Ceratodon purpureus]|uniref:Uncharacterized protein n=1 Tax=Ceratodon purpureus TaxID=3225 RepID=A0A8T0IDK8_CERPU|nr:hypothetical protein KC19_4G256600 [Ceratodon purpureus]